MKPLLLQEFFHDSYFLNVVAAAAFAEREEWEAGLLATLITKVARDLEAPRFLSPFKHLDGWLQMRWLTMEKRGEPETLILKAGKTTSGEDVRMLANHVPAEIRREIIEAVRAAIPAAEEHERLMAQWTAENPEPPTEVTH